MTVRAALHSLLSGDAGVAALVSTRIYRNTWPQGSAFPALTYQQIDRTGDDTHDGPPSLVAVRFQIGCWARDDGAAETLAEAVRQALDGQQPGAVGGSPPLATIDNITLEDERDGPADEVASDLSEIQLDFVVWHQP
jgi:hypothetical protein